MSNNTIEPVGESGGFPQRVMLLWKTGTVEDLERALSSLLPKLADI
jgi:hypothetical protein